MCRFDAITATTFDYYKCEGCGLCVRICPENALSLEAIQSAKAMTADTRFGPFFYAKMGIGEGNSGRIVDKVRKLAEAKAEAAQLNYVIIDGPPGIGCPVIASITGVDAVVIIIEPTLSGIHDLERVLGITAHFGIQAMVCINKYDLNEANTQSITDFCKEEGVAVVGVIPFDPIAPKSIVEQKTIFEMPENAIAQAITTIWQNIKKELEN
jgi:MinD superfamily P-loop ATPase